MKNYPKLVRNIDNGKNIRDSSKINNSALWLTKFSYFKSVFLATIINLLKALCLKRLWCVKKNPVPDTSWKPCQPSSSNIVNQSLKFYCLVATSENIILRSDCYYKHYSVLWNYILFLLQLRDVASRTKNLKRTKPYSFR